MTDAFAMLGLEPRFDLAPADVQRAYLARVAALHPDLAGGDPAAPARAAMLNDAKAAIEDPERRAEMLLLKLGGPAKGQDKGLPNGFLMEIMETREAVEEARRSRDPGAIARWEAWAEAERRRYIGVVGQLFARGNDPATLKEIRVQLNAWRYIERLIEQLDPGYDPARADFRA